MAELSLQERLQPSLLDRLTDDEPETQVESRSKRVLSLNRLKRSVLRDLAWLLNSTHLETVEELDEYPEARRSVINYGVLDLAGKTVSCTNIPELEREIRDAILHFEPRILADSLRININVNRDHMSGKTLSFQIEGQLWAQPLPISLFLSTELDLETGAASVKETHG